MAYKDTNHEGSGKSVGKRKSVGTGYDAPFQGYVNVELSDAQREVFQAWREGASPWEQLEASVSDGVNIAVKFVPGDALFLASGTQRREGSANAGLVVTARGRDAGTALLRLLYILAYLSHKPAWEDTQKRANPDRW